jgi:hypothetical protein
METLNKITQIPFPLAHLTRVRDLLYFDGPLLSLFQGNEGEYYLYYWCDADEEVNRWIVFKVESKALDAYLLRQTSLLQLITKAVKQQFYIVDLDDDLTILHCYSTSLKDLPPSYLPSQQSFYKAD